MNWTIALIIGIPIVAVVYILVVDFIVDHFKNRD